MSGTAITPVWGAVDGWTPDPENDRISLFGDGATADGGDDDEEKEIQFDELPQAAGGEPGKEPRIRNREWEARKFLAKERVREARLKAQIAERMAIKEEERFIRVYGELDDGESQFSDYDLTDDEGFSGGSVRGGRDGGADSGAESLDSGVAA